MPRTETIILKRSRGRPAKFGDRADDVIRVRVTTEQRADLKRVAYENNYTDVASLIRDAVDSFVGDYREVGVFRSPKISDGSRIVR